MENAKASSLNPLAKEWVPCMTTDKTSPVNRPSTVHAVHMTTKSVEDDQTHSEDMSFPEEENDFYAYASPVEALQHVFADVDPEKLLETFENANFNLEHTLNILLKLSIEELSPTTKQVCRYFLDGGCFRRDCAFSHDLENHVCKFWIRGNCLAADDCPFVHNIDISKIQHAMGSITLTDARKSTTLDALDKTQFPDLSNNRVSNTPIRPLTSAFANVVKRRRLFDQFPWIEPKIIESYLKFHENDFELVMGFIRKAYPRPPDFVDPPRITTAKKRKKIFTVKPPEYIPWLIAGSALSAEYKKFRSQAISFGKKRNLLYERAASAYKANRGDLAKKYSLEAQRCNEIMRELHREAAHKIFNARNSVTNVQEPFIDLHGLHVDEAVEFLEEAFETLERENYDGTVFVVTGTGHHSQNMIAKIGPAVQQWLTECEYTWTACSIDKRFGGMVAVDFHAH